MAILVGKGAVGAPGEIHTTQRNPLGMVCDGDDSIQYIYLQGIGSTIAGSVVTYSAAFLTALLVANAVGPVAYATAAVVADEFGWYIRDSRGESFSICMALTSTAGANAGFETTSGYVGDGRAAGDQIKGLYTPAETTGAAAVTAGARTFGPTFVDDNTGS